MRPTTSIRMYPNPNPKSRGARVVAGNFMEEDPSWRHGPHPVPLERRWLHVGVNHPIPIPIPMTPTLSPTLRMRHLPVALLGGCRGCHPVLLGLQWPHDAASPPRHDF